MILHPYVVQPGDTLWSIAQQTVAGRNHASDTITQKTSAVGSYWTELVRLNRAALASTQPLAHPGTTLRLPEPPPN